MPCHAMPYHTVPYYAMPYHAIPYQTIPYHTIPYHISYVHSQVALDQVMFGHSILLILISIPISRIVLKYGDVLMQPIFNVYSNFLHFFDLLHF